MFTGPEGYEVAQLVLTHLEARAVNGVGRRKTRRSEPRQRIYCTIIIFACPKAAIHGDGRDPRADSREWLRTITPVIVSEGVADHQ